MNVRSDFAGDWVRLEDVVKLKDALEYTASQLHYSQEQTYGHNGGATFRDCPDTTCTENAKLLGDK